MRLATEVTERENLFETLANESPVGLYIVQDGRFCYTNPTFQNTTGYEEDELLGRDALELVVPEDRERVRENAIKMLKGKRTLPYQFRVTHKNGSIKWITESVASIQYRGRRATLGDFIDITAHKQAEEALQAEKNKLQSLIDTIEDHITIRDRDYNLIYMGEHVKELWGDRTGEKCYRVLEGQDKVCGGCPAEKAFRDGKSHTSERKTVTPSGEVIIWDTKASPIKDAEGRIIACLEVARNITERKKAEEKLKDATQKWTSLVENTSDFIMIIDSKGKIQYINRAIPPHNVDHVVGKTLYDFAAPEHHGVIRKAVAKVFETGKEAGYESNVKHPNGVLSFKTVMIPIVEGDKVISAMSFNEDTTEHKLAEEKMQHLNLVLRAIRNINQLIARGTERDGLLKGACDTFVETRGYYSAWIALLDESGKLVTAAEAGLGKRFLQVMEGLKHGELPHCGCKVLEKPGALITKDVSAECENCPLAKEDTGRDAMSIRLEYGGKVYGLMTVSIPPGRAAEKEEQDLFEEIAGDIAFALHSMEQKQERKQAEEALQAEKNKLQSLIGAMEDTITIQDTEYNIIFQNEPSRIASGGDHLGEKCYRVYEGREGICEGCPVEKAFKDGKSHTTERKTAIGGEIAFWENTASPIRDAEGRIVSCLELARDITERKKQEQTLADELTQRRLLIDKSLDGIVVLDVDAEVVEANQRFADMLGYTLEEVRELHTWDWDKNFPREELLEMGQNVDEKGLHLETKHTRKDGSVIDVDISISGIICGGQKLIFCIQRDVTERNRAEEALQIERNKLQSVIDAMADALTIQDRDYNIIFQNEPSRKSTGGDRVGEKCYRAYEGRENICEDCPVEKAFKDGKPHTSERQRILPSGKLTFWENTANPIRDGKGEVVSCLEIGRNITERRNQEQALADELTRRRLLVDQSLDGIVVLDENDKVYEANQRFADMLGYTLEEVREMYTWDWEKNYSREQIHKQGRKADEKGFFLETKHTRKDGSVIDVDISINASMFGGQKLIFCVCRDVTERKKAEQALADELTRRRLLIDQSLDGIVVLDVDAKVVEANQSFADMLGYTLEEVRELHTWDWDKNYSREQIREQGREADEKGFHLETKHTRKDGSVIDVDISINGTMCGGQKLIFCVCRDITERKKMEEALKLAAEEWRGTFDSITDAISIHDRDFRILRANKAFADIFHMRPDQIIGKHCYELHKGGKPISGCPHKQTLATGKPAAAEFYESNLGKYLLESTSPIFDEKGEIVGTIHVTRDITEQKQQNERLMMADRLASIGELAAGTAHELNNPLTSVIGFTQLVMEKDIPDDIREDLKLIHNEAQRAAGVTKNLLTFARKQAPVKQLNQINNIIEDVLKLRAYEHKVNSIEVQTQLAPDLPEIKVDYFQMQQVFLNIIINAEYFMIEAHNKGTLTITTKKRNGSVKISIADDGPGIPSENLSRIFNPFFTTKAAGKGTGLGLSICHGIVSEHGGQIYAKSQPSKGTTIVVELPVNGH
jgi:PAS domain S-box-containing protein